MVGDFLESSLRKGCRYPLDSLLRRSQRDQGYTDYDERSHAPQFSACRCAPLRHVGMGIENALFSLCRWIS